MKTFFDDKIWSLKYRPKTLVELCLPDRIRLQAENIISSGDVPNMLFSGQAGVGKTTLAFVIAETLDYDTLYLNLSDKSGIDIIRTEFKNFASSVSLKGKKKIIIGDEFDRLTPQAQDMLKVFIEKFSNNTSFIFISNHINKIAEPIMSRIPVVDFNFSKDEISQVKKIFYKRLVTIFKEDKITFDKESLISFIKTYFPDMRKTIEYMQVHYNTYNSLTNVNQYKSYKDDINEYFKFIKSKNYPAIRTWLENSSINSNVFYQMCYNVLPKYIDLKRSPEAIAYLADRSFEALNGVDIKINISAFSIDLMTCEIK
jgi:replication factor C small subunit